MECLIGKVDQALFLSVSGLAIMVGLTGFVKDFTMKFDELNAKLKSSAGADPATKLPFLPSREKQRLIQFDVPQKFAWLVQLAGWSLASLVVFLISARVPSLSEEPIYACLIGYATWVGLLPALGIYFVLLWLLWHFVKLWKVTTNRGTG